jgi:hypothetical protein
MTILTRRGEVLRAFWIGLVVLVGLASTAEAAFTVKGSRFGPATRIYDSNSGLTWLSTGVTQGVSYNDIVQNLDGGETYAGYRFATGTELQALFASLDIPALFSPEGASGVSTPETLAGARKFIDLFGGATFADGSGELMASFASGGAWPDESSGLLLNVASVNLSTGHVTFVDDLFGFFKPESYADLGAFLVSTKPTHATSTALNSRNLALASPVPEPQTYALMLAGLAALAMVVRRRRQRQRG